MSLSLGSADLASRRDAQNLLRRRHPDQARIKVNLYTGAEARAVAASVSRLESAGRPSRIDCLMVGDSYLMTHLGRASTRLESESEQREIFDLMLRLVRDVSLEARRFPGDPRPWVLADLPDGAMATPGKAADSIARMIDAGADAVKLEVISDSVFDMIAAAAARGQATVAHIGYKPQAGANRKYGDTEDEARALMAEARRARDAGAIGLVLERVSQPVVGLLSRPHAKGLPNWSIFCGQALGAGQSLNVFDSVVKPSFAAIGFPPTSTLTRDAFPSGYTHEVIADHFAGLLDLAYAGTFPPRLSSGLDEAALARLADVDIWG